MWKQLKFYTVLVVVVGLGLVALYYRFQALRATPQISRTIDSATVVRQVQQLNELVTVRYTLQKAIGLKENKVPFGSESVLMLVSAQVLGGIDLASLTSNDVNIASPSSITVQLPAPRLLHVFIDDKQTQVWDRSKTLFVPTNPQLEQTARQTALEAIQQAALDMGILSNAQQNAQSAIRSLLQTAGFSTVQFAQRP